PAAPMSQKQKAETPSDLSTPPTKSNSTMTASTPLAKSNGSSDNAAIDYKTSLTALSTLYQSEVQRLEQRNNQSKELYKDGLISRVELEGSDKVLADAQIG